MFLTAPAYLFGKPSEIESVNVGQIKKLSYFAAAISQITLAFGMFATPVMAQVSGTEVDQEDVDEFGLEMKTGRFSWSTHEVIGIGGENSRVNIAVTGVRNPAKATRIWPLDSYFINLNQPRLLSEPKPDRNSTIPGAILLNVYDHTVETPYGSESFVCESGLVCLSEYFTGSTLVQTPSGFVYTNRDGVEIFFDESSSVVRMPDGKESIYKAGQYHKNNFGFMIKHSTVGFQAVNQSVDFCILGGLVPCSGLGNVRTAKFDAPAVNVRNLVDSEGHVTQLRWEPKSAKLFRRPQGAPASVFIDSATENYPTGITFPGSTSEDITISYHPIDPAVNTHDDIVVSSITSSGVTATYEYNRYFPYGIAEYKPTASETLGRMTGPGSLYDIAQFHCNSGSADACSDVRRMEAIISALEQMAEFEALQQPIPPEVLEPFESGSLGPNTYELTITRKIAGQLDGSSFAILPLGTFGQKRRRLEYIVDANGLQTSFEHNMFEEVAGITYPEGNGVLKTPDQRGNLERTRMFPKTGSTASAIDTVYSYLPDCTNIPLARCNKPITVTDPRGSVTEYTYNDRGQILTEIKPAATPGAARPKVTNEYTMRTAYIKDANGNPIAAGPPISLLTRSSACISTASCAGTLDEVFTEYDYGPITGLNNLNLRGVAVTAKNSAGELETQRTCYQYNYFGERIAEVRPLGTGSSCP